MVSTNPTDLTIRPSRPDDRDALVDVWLRSVQATHAFLTEADVQELLPLVRDVALAELEVWVLAADGGPPAGFVGLSGNKIEALFLAPERRRTGGGRRLVEHAHALRGPTLLVDVNEQNPDAVRFYEAVGFVVEGRSEVDGQGKPFPLLHMRRTTTTTSGTA